MGISCEEVWRDISDYIDEDLDPVQRASLDQHFAECDANRCCGRTTGIGFVLSQEADSTGA